jgi:hypothetical protein
MSDERIEWPPPREDPEEEPSEPWAKAEERKGFRELWERLRGEHGKSEP